MPARLASTTEGTSAVESSGASTMPSTPWATKSCDDVDLSLAVVLQQRAFPVDLDVAHLLGRLQGAGVHRFPEDVRRALGNHGQRQRLGRIGCARGAGTRRWRA